MSPSLNATRALTIVSSGTEQKPIWIPAELCTVMAGQPYRGKLNGSQTTRMLRIAARPPAENASRIMAEDGGLGLIGVLPTVSQNLVCSLSLGFWPDSGCQTNVSPKSAFGVNVNPQMIAVPGRVLSSPKVTYHGKAKANMKGGASWNMIDRKFITAATILPWAMLRIGAAAKISESALLKPYDNLIASFKLCGLGSEGAKIRPGSGPLIPELKGPGDQSGINKVFVNTELRSKFQLCEPKGISMLLVILPSNDSWLYDRIKYFGDVVYGIPSPVTMQTLVAVFF